MYTDHRFIIYALLSQLANKSQLVMDLGMKDITCKQWFPLIMIERFNHEPTLKEISEKCGITHQSTKQLLDKLVEKDYVIARKDEADKRCLRYSLTEKGKSWGIDNFSRNQVFMKELFRDISEEELKLFLSVERRLLDKLNAIYSNPEYWMEVMKKEAL